MIMYVLAQNDMIRGGHKQNRTNCFGSALTISMAVLGRPGKKCLTMWLPGQHANSYIAAKEASVMEHERQSQDSTYEGK